MKYIKILILILILLYVLFWLFSFKKYQVNYGISFNQDHAVDLGLDWKEVYTEMLNDLKPKYIRVAAMWSDVEEVKNQYDFSNVDFMMDEAQKHGAKAVLVVGQKAPRWPECHVPEWLDYGQEGSKQHLLGYVEKTVERYKNHPALEIWQVENEPFIRFEFGNCENYDEEAIFDEIDLVRSLDSEHKILVTDSGELSTWWRSSKAGDLFGTTMYRVVRTPNGMKVSYAWMPAGFYRLKAALYGRTYNDYFVSELQAEPWFNDSNPTNTSIEEQEKTMDPTRLKKHFKYVEHVGTSRSYLWGVEWWYFMKEVKNDSRYWDIVKGKLSN